MRTRIGICLVFVFVLGNICELIQNSIKLITGQVYDMQLLLQKNFRTVSEFFIPIYLFSLISIRVMSIEAKGVSSVPNAV